MTHNAALAEASPIEQPVMADAPYLKMLKGGAEGGEAPAPVNIRAVPDSIDVVPAETAQGRLIDADGLPELAAKRQRARENAARILGQNRHLLHTAGAEYVPAPVDALGTVRQVVKAKREYGVDSTEYKELFEGAVLDNERLTGEAATRNVSEHFEETLQVFRPETQEYFSHGLSISTMLENGLTPLGEQEEQDRRPNEFVEEDGTLVPIGSAIADVGLQGMVEQLDISLQEQMPAIDSVEVTTFSRCTDYAEEGYKIDPKASYGGYRPGMKGIAIRRNHFKDDSGDRYEEQAIISGIYITGDVIQEELAERGAIDKSRELTKTELHSKQFISVNDDSVMNLVEALDIRASKKHGKNLFMGEEVPTEHPKDYGTFMEEARERKERLAPMPTLLTEYAIELEEQGVDSRAAEVLINKFLKEELLARAEKNPELAKAMFDEETAEGFKEVARLKARGEHKAAHSLQLLVEANAPDVEYCSGGFCGTSALTGAAAVRAKELGLAGTDLMLNTEHACTNCNEMQLCHDELGNTVCLSCDSTKLKGKGVKAKAKAHN